MRKAIQALGRGLVFLTALLFAVVFLLPTVLTITNSFMSGTELAANYGVVFSSLSSTTTYISDQVNLKFIPDHVSFSQYATALLKSPDYLFKVLEQRDFGRTDRGVPGGRCGVRRV